jgi:uncharacterized surface protein with fasciclin (FAS1) repeats
MKKLYLPLLCIILLHFLICCANNTQSTRSANQLDIEDLVNANKRLNSFAIVLRDTDLSEMLRGDGPFTVFAPVNEAFVKLQTGKDGGTPYDSQKLTKLLLYHIVPGKISSADMAALKKARTVLGKSVSINVRADEIMIDNAKLIATDIEASNGVIHLIDGVISPFSEQR